MPITRSGSSHIEQWLQQRMEVLNQRIIQALHNVGLQATTNARESHRYKDQTGNLTSSIGYVIVQDGEIVSESSFETISVTPDKEKGIKGGTGTQGTQDGRNYAHQIAEENPTGTYLIIVAGMPYAMYVEAKGLNVLDSAKVYAKADVPNKIRSVLNRMKK